MKQALYLSWPLLWVWVIIISECDCAALRTGNPPEILRAEGICSYTEVPAFATLRVGVCASGSLFILVVRRPAVPSEHGHSPFLCFIKCSFKIRSTSNFSVNVMKLKVGSSQARPAGSLCPTGYAQNVGHPWAGFLVDYVARELVCCCTTHNWNQLLRKAVPPSEIEVGERCSEFSWPHFPKFQTEGNGASRTPQRASNFTADSASQRPSQSLLVLSTDSYIHTGVASLIPALPSCPFCTHVPVFLYLPSAVTQGCKSTSLCFWAIWADGRQAPSSDLPQVSPDMSLEWSIRHYPPY